MKTIREETFGKAIVRLVQTPTGYAGVVIRNGVTTPPVHGDNPISLWIELVEDLDRSSVSYFGYDGARTRFLKLFPEGFQGANYRAHERDYKVAASATLNEIISAEDALDATADTCALVAKVFSKANLLAPVEQARVHQMLKSEHAVDFVRGAALLATGNPRKGLLQMQTAIKPFGQASWPAATYLPYLWKPNEHMFLKPRVTVDYAERVGHSFARDYNATFSADVYASLQSLTADTRRSLAALEPKDNIDLQSFIWIVGAYPETDEVAALTD